jgi:hypothetical protein
VRSLAVTCELCHHEAVLGADDWSDGCVRARLLAAHGLHLVRDRRRGRPAELAGDEGAGEVTGYVQI